MSTYGLLALTVVAFSANSILCRLALHDGAIDAMSFTAVRIAAGALMLAGFVRPVRPLSSAVNWRAAAVLFVYAVPFSFAYTRLPTGTGALLMFAAVQATMIGAAVFGGDRLRLAQWAGILAAFLGLMYLVWPGVAAPPLGGAALMVAAGIAWGVYSLLGRRTADAAAQTVTNFLLTTPMVVLATGLNARAVHLTPQGVLWAALSGALASGLGYIVWYRAVRRVSTVTASVVQLLVPLVTAAGGAVVLGEQVSMRLALAACLIVGGIAVAVTARRNR